MNLNYVIYQELKALGVPRHILGYECIHEAVLLVLDDPSLLHRVTKGLYPAIATKFNTTSSRVERNIRHAIEQTFDRGDMAGLHRVFGHAISVDSGKLPNTRFIAELAEYIKMEVDYD